MELKLLIIYFLATQPSNIVASLFRLNEEGGNTCILLRVDAVIEVKFKTKLGSEDVSYINNQFQTKFVFITVAGVIYL